MKNLVTSLLGIAFLIVGTNIASIGKADISSNLQTVAASTVPQPQLSNILNNNVKNANPDTVYDTIKVKVPVSCNHKRQPTKTIVKKTVIKKTDTSYVPLLWIAEPGEKADSTNRSYTIRKGELSDYKQIISKVCK